jgi:Xaa-Pro aminopeptidase
MKNKGLDALLIWGGVGNDYSGVANIHYLTQWGGGGEEGFLIFPLEGEPYLINCHSSNYQNKCWEDYGCWVPAAEIKGRDGLNWIPALNKAIKELGLAESRLGIPWLAHEDVARGWSTNPFPYYLYEGITEAFPKAELIDVSGLIETIRSVKSPEEITFLEKSHQIAEAAIETMANTAKPGISEHVVIAEMFRTMMIEGADIPMLFLWDAGEPLSGGGRLGWTKHRILQPKDIIFFEFSPKVHHMSSHLNQTSVIHEIPDGLEKSYEVWKKSYRAGFDAVKPGLTTGELFDILREPIEAAGLAFKIGYHGTGHGNDGFGFPEYLDVEIDPSKSGVPFREGETIAFEPMAILPDGRGVRMGGTVVVTKDGARPLGKEPDLIIIK